MFNRGYEHVLSFALEHPWNIEPQMLPVIAGILARHVAGVDSSAEIAAALVNRKNLPQPRAGSVAIIPIYGVIAPRMNMMSDMSGGTTYDRILAQLREVMANKAVRTIVLDIDSPGGSVAGNAECAAEIMRSRTKKPIIAQIQYTGASAAYQIAAACTEIIAAPSARVGSIGTFAIHDDLSKALEEAGISRTYISAGDGKVDGNPSEALSDRARGRWQAAIDEAYGQFVGNVVKGRGAGMTVDRVKSEWKAFVYSAAEALSIEMIDGIATLDETVARVLSASPDADDQRAALDFTSSPAGTDQELPTAATSQDRLAMLALERAVFELQLTTAS